MLAGDTLHIWHGVSVVQRTCLRLASFLSFSMTAADAACLWTPWQHGVREVQQCSVPTLAVIGHDGAGCRCSRQLMTECIILPMLCFMAWDQEFAAV